MKPLSQETIKKLGPWIAFALLFSWGWRVKNIFTHIPAYEDVLEVVWGIRWYHETIFVQHTSPLFTPFVFHPLGWHTATLAHTPFLFTIALPLYEVGGEAFAYNVLVIAALALSLAGAIRFSRLFITGFPAIVTALVFTFIEMHFSRAKGHVHMLWAFALLPWLALAMEKVKYSFSPQMEKRLLFAIGLIWGVMINFALYSLFIGAMVFALWGLQIFQKKRLKQFLMSALIACVLASPVLALQFTGRQQDKTLFFGVDHNVYWGASLNSLFAPSAYHPIPMIQKVARSIYHGPYSETETPNFGLSTWILALIGSIIILRKETRSRSLLSLAIIGLTLGLGPLLKWDGKVIEFPLFRPLNALIWGLGHALKPLVFNSPWLESPFDTGIPLPGFLLTALIPFWELGRVASRYALVGGLGVMTLAGIALRHFPKALRYIVAIAWLMEILPSPTAELPLPRTLHPAYKWVMEQPLEQGEGIVDLAFPTVTLRPENLWATLFHRRPTASGSGSSLPQHFFTLWAHLMQNPKGLAEPDIGLLLRQYRVKYVLLHFAYGGEEDMWDLIATNPAFKPIGCFEPLKEPSPWYYPICVAEVRDLEGPMNLVRLEGWSDEEYWGGIWAQGTFSRAQWLALKPEEHVLQVRAFPFCIPDRQQQLLIKLNRHEIAFHKWEDCEVWEGEFLLRSPAVRRGWNEFTFEYSYALSPFDVTGGVNPDKRALSVGFLKLWVKSR